MTVKFEGLAITSTSLAVLWASFFWKDLDTYACQFPPPPFCFFFIFFLYYNDDGGGGGGGGSGGVFVIVVILLDDIFHWQRTAEKA